MAFFPSRVGRLLSVWLVLGLAPAGAQVTDLVVSRSNDDAVLTWATGTPPFRVLRSQSPTFDTENRLVAEGLFGLTATDVEAFGPSEPGYFYVVVSNGEPDPPGFIANPPIPIAFITSITPDVGSPGDVVTLEGGNFDPESGHLLVRFQDAEHNAVILSATETQIVVEVPPGTLTGEVSVCQVGRCSNGVLFKRLLAGGFQDLSSMAFEPGTGSLWVADRGSVDRVFELPAGGGAPVQRGSINEPLLGHPSPGNGNGRIYFSNSSTTLPNVGTIRYVQSATNQDLVFDQAGISSGVTQDVRCEGLAASDSQPNVAYFLDGRGNTIRRIVQGAVAHDLSYGNQLFTFNRPAGARFDGDGNLYVSATTAIFKILPAEAGVVQVATGFTAAAGIDLIEDTGVPLLLVADEATGTIWLVDGESGSKEAVGHGFSGPVGVAFSQDPVTGALFYDVAEPTRILRLPDPRIDFEVRQTADYQVLVSKRVASDMYFSRDQSEDRKIEVRAKVHDGGNPVPGKMVYFRLRDPQDPSGYLNGHTGDNLPTSPAGGITASDVSDADGMVTAILEVDPQYVGNNYEVEASFDPLANFKKVARSVAYTSWRRLYIEHDRMYKEGSFLTQTSGAGQPNPARVSVQSSAVFSVGDEVHILSGDGIPQSDGEIGMVAAVEPVPGCNCVDLQAPLALSYSEPFAGVGTFPHGFLARRAGNFFDALPSRTQIEKAFDDGFTSWIVLSNSDGFIPFWSFATGSTFDERRVFVAARSPWFFRNYDLVGSPPKPFVNHVQLVSAARLEEIPGPPGATTLGLSQADNSLPAIAANWSWIFNQTIAAYAPTNAQNVRDHALAHELGHQLNVNGGAPGHDTEASWDAPGVLCLMNAVTSATTSSIPKFHARPAAPTRDLLCIRTHVDNLNEDLCP